MVDVVDNCVEVDCVEAVDFVAVSWGPIAVGLPVEPSAPLTARDKAKAMYCDPHWVAVSPTTSLSGP